MASAAMPCASMEDSIVFFMAVGVRPDLGSALETIRFPFKFVVTLLLFATAAILLNVIISPGRQLGARPHAGRKAQPVHRHDGRGAAGSVDGAAARHRSGVSAGVVRIAPLPSCDATTNVVAIHLKIWRVLMHRLLERCRKIDLGKNISETYIT